MDIPKKKNKYRISLRGTRIVFGRLKSQNPSDINVDDEYESFNYDGLDILLEMSKNERRSTKSKKPK